MPRTLGDVGRPVPRQARMPRTLSVVGRPVPRQARMPRTLGDVRGGSGPGSCSIHAQRRSRSRPVMQRSHQLALLRARGAPMTRSRRAAPRAGTSERGPSSPRAHRGWHVGCEQRRAPRSGPSHGERQGRARVIGPGDRVGRPWHRDPDPARPQAEPTRRGTRRNARRNRRPSAESPEASSSGLKASVHRPLRARPTMARDSPTRLAAYPRPLTSQAPNPDGCPPLVHRAGPWMDRKRSRRRERRRHRSLGSIRVGRTPTEVEGRNGSVKRRRRGVKRRRRSVEG